MISAIFLITALALLAAMMTRLYVMGTTESMNELYSAQALYAAESGAEWAANRIINGATADTTDTPANPAATAWFSTTVSSVTVGGEVIYTILSTGEAGGTATAPRVQRQIETQFMP
jgi:outer membrane protein assembly factor BamA